MSGVADKQTFERLRSMDSEAEPDHRPELRRFRLGHSIPRVDSFEEYCAFAAATGVEQIDSQPDCDRCDLCTDTVTTTSSDRWLRAAVEAAGWGVVLGLAALLADEIGVGWIFEVVA